MSESFENKDFAAKVYLVFANARQGRQNQKANIAVGISYPLFAEMEKNDAFASFLL
ncbi:hypothetical protein [Draconibacterium mangrovi]|uniref:hypothetical protein n=1 Tax=Draconibacterium mangrovi TaxID=2697469 RepID=UPI0013D8BEB6|nr:hypothetical protein [Draconibacterium mangrovi]